MKRNHRRRRQTDRNLREELGPHVRNGWTRERGRHLDKSMHGPRGVFDALSGRIIAADAIGNDFCRGKCGMAKAVRGAKKFISTRRRFHARMRLKRIIRDGGE